MQVMRSYSMPEMAANIIIVIIWLGLMIAIIAAVPSYTDFSGATGYALQPAKYLCVMNWKSRKGRDQGFIYFILFCLIAPIAIMVVTYTLILRKVAAVRREQSNLVNKQETNRVTERNQIQVKNDKEKRLVTTFIALVVSYVVPWVLNIVIGFLQLTFSIDSIFLQDILSDQQG